MDRISVCVGGLMVAGGSCIGVGISIGNGSWAIGGFLIMIAAVGISLIAHFSPNS